MGSAVINLVCRHRCGNRCPISAHVQSSCCTATVGYGHLPWGL